MRCNARAAATHAASLRTEPQLPWPGTAPHVGAVRYSVCAATSTASVIRAAVSRYTREPVSVFAWSITGRPRDTNLALLSTTVRLYAGVGESEDYSHTRTRPSQTKLDGPARGQSVQLVNRYARRATRLR